MENSTDVLCTDCTEILCTDCRLESNTLSEENITKNIVPGLFLILIALRLSYVYIFKVESEGLRKEELGSKGTSSSSKPQRLLLANLPWDGIIFLGASGTGIILTVLFAQNYEKTEVSDIYLVTFYIAFSFYGVLDVARYFKKGFRSRSEKLLKMFSLGLALVIEAVLHMESVRAGKISEILQMSTIICGAVSAFCGFFHAQANVILGISLLVQGTWMIQKAGGEPGEGEEEMAWAQIYFSWHLIIVSCLFFVVFMLKGRRLDKDEDGTTSEDKDSKFCSLKSKCSTPSTRTTKAGDPEMLDNSFLQKQMPVYPNTEVPAGLSVLPKSELLLPTKQMSALQQLPKISTVDEISDCLRSVSSTSTEPCESALQQHQRGEMPTVGSGVKSPRHPVVSPAPSTTSTSLSIPQAEDRHFSAAHEDNSLPAAGQHPSQQQLQHNSTSHHPTSAKQQQLGYTTHSFLPHSLPQHHKPDPEPAVYENAPMAPALLESEPFDRISPIDEYNTLSRHIQSVRASIKLKESKFV